jgi:hypothetical protein
LIRRLAACNVRRSSVPPEEESSRIEEESRRNGGGMNEEESIVKLAFRWCAVAAFTTAIVAGAPKHAFAQG